MKDRTLVPSICPYCGVGCGLFIAVEDGVISGLEYMRDHPTSEGALCPKGNASLDIVYHPDRLKYPLKRANGGFERITWNEALSSIASNLMRIRKDHGDAALGFLASAKATNEENYLFQKLARMLGSNNVDHCARL
jgi:formate dehydrogenase major subunit